MHVQMEKSWEIFQVMMIPPKAGAPPQHNHHAQKIMGSKYCQITSRAAAPHQLLLSQDEGPRGHKIFTSTQISKCCFYTLTKSKMRVSLSTLFI